MPRRRSGQQLYCTALRGNVRALWSGEWDREQFNAAMLTSIDRGYNAAWLEGAEPYGIRAIDELTSEERAQLNSAILVALQSAPGFADAIIAGSKENGGKLTPLLTRAKLWCERYAQVQGTAGTMAAGNRAMMWVLGQAEHCPSCLKLAGKVKRASYWVEHGILPRDPNTGLACGGFRCQCSLEPTTDPISKGPLPRLP